MRAFAFGEQIDGVACPTRPMAEQAADDTQARLSAVGPQREFSQQIDDDVIIVAGVERDFIGAVRFSQRTDNIERLIAAEGGDLDGDNVRNFNEAAPEAE